MELRENSCFRNKFGEDIFNHKYAHEDCETYPALCRTLVEDVCRDKMAQDEKDQLVQYMVDWKVVFGGRYLYYAGRNSKFFNNCYLLKAEEDNREDWANLSWKAESCLMTGGGIGVDYSVYRPSGELLRKTGGLSSGPIPKMYMINEIGRNVMQGGSRRSAIYASLNWKHGDIEEFLKAKNWDEQSIADIGYSFGDIKKKDFNFNAPLDMTNMSVNYDTDWLTNYWKTGDVGEVFRQNIRLALRTAEPGFSFNFFDRENETLRNACQPENATVLTPKGITKLKNVSIGDVIWSGNQWTKVTHKWSSGVRPVYKYTTTTGYFLGTSDHRVVEDGEKVEVQNAETIDWCVGDSSLLTDYIDASAVMDGLVVGDGAVHKASNNLVHLFIGNNDCDYFDSEIKNHIVKPRPGLSEKAYEIKTTIKPEELPKTYARYVPDRYYYGDEMVKRSFLRGLFSANGTISGGRVCLKQTSRKLIVQVQEMLSSLGIHSYITTNKGKDIKFANGVYKCKKSYDINITSGRSLFKTYIGFIQKYKQNKIEEGSPVRYTTSSIKSVEYINDEEVFHITVDAPKHTYWTGGVLVSNCTEVTSSDDSDVCNLGSINLAAISDVEELSDVVILATKFLLCGTLVADLPYAKIAEVREKNRRLGLGLMGLHEWLLQRNEQYEVTPELHRWLTVYKRVSDNTSKSFAEHLGVSKPVANRAIAPTGSIGILAGTTTGIEPLFATAYKRRYLKNGARWHYQYIVDSTARTLVEEYGLDPDSIDTALTLANDYERRIKFQADVQDYVDMAISSTINLPKWGSPLNNEDRVNDFAETLAKYSHRLRGFTCYPDGARGGQPLVAIPYSEAVDKHGTEFEEESHDICDITGHGGACGV